MLHDVVQRKKFYTLVLQKCLTRSMYELFPIGYEMTVRYNPKRPQLAFVERYAGGESFFRFVSLFYLITLIILSLVLFVVII